jgi:hypothetical protein
MVVSVPRSDQSLLAAFYYHFGGGKCGAQKIPSELSRAFGRWPAVHAPADDVLSVSPPHVGLLKLTGHARHVGVLYL